MHSTSFQFEDDDWLKIESFVEAVGACKSKIARKAFHEYIERELKNNPGMNEKYQEQRARLLAKAGNNIALIGAKRKSRKKSSQSIEPSKEVQSQK